MRKFAIGMFALALFSACSNEDELSKTIEPFAGDEAYVTISLRNANGVATRGTDGKFEYGLANENAVTSAEFYFYNADGSYNQHVSKVLSWNTNNDAPAVNIEKFADATVVLTGLKDKTTPKYVVAVLNGTANAYVDKNLVDVKEAIVEDYKTGNYFIMTNSTYNGGDAVEATGYFATALTDNNFLSEKPTQDQLTSENDVDIYVERVAVKVRVGFGDDLVVTDNNKVSLGNYEVDGVSKDIQIELLNWGLNATNKDSYLEKRVPAWDYTLGDFVWSDPTNFRSYWAKSTNYAAGAEYPVSYGKAEDGTSTLVSVTPAEAALNYVSWESLTKGFSGANSYDYCLENTNTKGELTTSNFYAKVTHVLLKAQVVGGEDLVRYDGQLFTENGFKARVLNLLNLPAIHKETTAGEGITTADLTVSTLYDGNVTVALVAPGTVWVDNENHPVNVKETLEKLAVDAEYYESGMMYYNIPIEHLRGGTMSIATDGAVSVEEADYGVVRNHCYDLKINKIENLGVSVWDPAEPIVPNLETPSFYVGASINILSWKVVNQNVEL